MLRHLQADDQIIRGAGQAAGPDTSGMQPPGQDAAPGRRSVRADRPQRRAPDAQISVAR